MCLGQEMLMLEVLRRARLFSSDTTARYKEDEDRDNLEEENFESEIEMIKLEPDFGPNNANFPPLPEICDPSIELQVFTHRSFYARPTHVFEDHPDDLSPDNERYEHLGDTVLGMVVTNLMFDMFPGLRVGPSTKIRSLVVGNATLADISKRYRLSDRLRLHPAQAITLRASTHIQADVFESFVGGLFRDQDVNAVQRWLNLLFRPFAQAAYEHVRKQHNLPPLPPSYQHSSHPNHPHQASHHPHQSHAQAQGGVRPLGAGSTANGDPIVSANGNGQGGGSGAGGDGHGESAVGPTIGHLALFNQQVAKANRQVEWVYSDGCEPGLDDVRAVGADRRAISNNGSGSATSLANPTDANTATTGTTGNVHWYSDPCVPAHLRIKGTQVTPVWYVKVLVDGEFYGRGRGNTKKAARNEAAKEGLVKLGVEVEV